MATHTIRAPAVAGLFYPDEPSVLASQVGAFLSQASPATLHAVPKAFIVPHAGYIYSGAIAASAYALAARQAARIRRVVLLGPSHRVPLAGLALPGCDGFATPLGEVPVEHEWITRLAQRPGVRIDDRPHEFEHSLEVQLPFVQSVLDHVSVLPVAVGTSTPELVADFLDAVWGGPETLILVSTDFSHYLDYRSARSRDEATLARVSALQPDIRPDQACGAAPLNGLLLAAQRHTLQAHLLDARNSGDTAGDRNRVVGYAALAFTSHTQTLH